MGSVGAAEILVILVVALIVLGPERLPDAARQVGHVIGELRRIGNGLQAEVRNAMDVDVRPRPVEQRPQTPQAPPPERFE